MTKESAEPIITAKPKRETKSLVEPESQVVVHCTVRGMPFFARIRVWPSTYLVDAASKHSSKLVHAENIVYVPQWQPIPQSGVARFTLIFSGLPKGCTHFNLVEIINEPGGWLVKDIKRNAQDVYRIEL